MNIGASVNTALMWTTLQTGAQAHKLSAQARKLSDDAAIDATIEVARGTELGVGHTSIQKMEFIWKCAEPKVKL